MKYMKLGKNGKNIIVFFDLLIGIFIFHHLLKLSMEFMAVPEKLAMILEVIDLSGSLNTI